jgi:hypothetical protein
MVRTTLPRVLPPTLKGDVVKAVRYIYYITAAIRWSWCAQENGHSSPPHATISLERLVSMFAFLVLVCSNLGLVSECAFHFPMYCYP